MRFEGAAAFVESVVKGLYSFLGLTSGAPSIPE